MKQYYSQHLDSEATDGVFTDMLSDIVLYGEDITTRNSDTKRLTNLAAVFTYTPLVSIRRTAWHSAIAEFEWFLSGSPYVSDLPDKVKKWWLPWADKITSRIWGNYSEQFRAFYGREGKPVDQIAYLIKAISDHPYGRRSVITTWNTADMVSSQNPITNCHGTVIQAFVKTNNTLDLTMYQRSADMVLGVPHNWIQYWAFLLYLSKQADKEPGSLTWIGGDCHVYANHVDIAKQMIDRFNNVVISSAPQLVYVGQKGDEFKASDFVLVGEYDPIIKQSAPMTV